MTKPLVTIQCESHERIHNVNGQIEPVDPAQFVVILGFWLLSPVAVTFYMPSESSTNPPQTAVARRIQKVRCFIVNSASGNKRERHTGTLVSRYELAYVI